MVIIQDCTLFQNTHLKEENVLQQYSSLTQQPVQQNFFFNSFPFSVAGSKEKN